MSTSQISIRRATVKDAALVASFGARTFEQAYASQNTKEDMDLYISSYFNEAVIRSQLLDPSSVFLLAYKDNRLIGYSMLHAGAAPDAVSGSEQVELVRIYIDGNYMGKGFGSMLMAACIKAAIKNGHDVIWLGVWEKNESAIAFYRKWDFEKVGMKTFVVGTDVQDDFIMEKRLNLVT